MSKGLIFPFLKDRMQFTFGISKVIIGYQKSSIYFSLSLPASNESIISNVRQILHPNTVPDETFRISYFDLKEVRSFL